MTEEQSVSKWESGASIPDLDKILKMSSLFDVSTDYLLKDEIESMEEPVKTEEKTEEKGSCRSISLEEANTFMDLSRKSAGKIALAVGICILSVIPLIVLGGMAEYGKVPFSEDAAGGLGMVILLLCIAPAVVIFILEGIKLEKYDYLEKEIISLQYGVEGIVSRRKEAFAEAYRRSVAAGTLLCILGVIALFVAAFLDAGDLICIYFVGGMLAFIAAGVYLFVWSGCIWESFQKLLQEEDYRTERKKSRRYRRNFAGIYWCIITAIFLADSLPHKSWETSWVIWPVAGVAFAAVMGICNIIAERKKAN